MIRAAAIASCFAVALMCGCPAPESVGQATPTGDNGAPAPGVKDDVRAMTPLATSAADLPKVEVKEWRLVSAQTISLNVATVATVLPSSPTPVKVPVKLESVTYWADVSAKASGASREETRKLYCLKLQSTDAALPYEWWYVPSAIPGMFHLMPSGTGAAYLAWSIQGAAEFANVSHPRSRDAALARFLVTPNGKTQADIEHIPVLALAGSKIPFIGLNAQNYDIHVTSIARGEAGGYEVRLRGTDKSKEFVFASHDGEWSLKSPPYPPATK